MTAQQTQLIVHDMIQIMHGTKWWKDWMRIEICACRVVVVILNKMAFRMCTVSLQVSLETTYMFHMEHGMWSINEYKYSSAMLKIFIS